MSEELIFYYDESEELIGFHYNGHDYFYGKDCTGIIRYIYGENGDIIVTYHYDASLDLIEVGKDVYSYFWKRW